jgi:hypothetical protein
LLAWREFGPDAFLIISAYGKPLVPPSIHQEIHVAHWSRRKPAAFCSGKTGGPVIAIQLENEYSGPTEHLMTLKQIARDAGMDVPLYTYTGWGSDGEAPFGETVPFSGAYVDGFWDRSLAGGGYGVVLRFSGFRRGNAAAMGMLGGSSATTNAVPANAMVRNVYLPLRRFKRSAWC